MSSLRGKLAVFICFFLLAAFVSTARISDYDFWWHLKLGELACDSGELSPPDEFSYTHLGKPQFSAEWLANLVIYLSYRSGGFVGVNLLKTSVLLLTFCFLFLTMKNIWKEEEAGFYASVLTLVIVLFALRFRLFVRPYLFSFLFFAVYLYLISGYEKSRNMRLLFLLPFVQLLWANMSSGAIFGPFLLGAFAMADSLRSRLDRTVFSLLAGIVLISLVNPSGIRIYSLPLTLLVNSQYKETIGEHQPITFQLLWGYGFRYTFAYQLLVIGSLVSIIFFQGWRRVYGLVLFIVFFLSSVMMVRMIDFFSLASVVFFLPSAEKGVSILLSVLNPGRRLTALAASVLVLAAMPLAAMHKAFAFGAGVKEGAVPEAAISFLEKEGINGRIFNSYPLGGYLIWRAPERKVFIDGRSTHLYGPEFFNKYFESLKKAETWSSLEQQWGFDYALLEYDRMSRRFPLHINENPEWAVVYWDDHAAVYLKRTEQNRGTIEKYPFRITRPAFYDFSYLQPILHSKTGVSAVEQIDREIALNPANQEPRLAKAFLLYNLGKSFHEKAYAELVVTLGLLPDLAMEHSAAAIILAEKGDTDRAREEVKKALKLDPADQGALHLRKKLGG